VLIGQNGVGVVDDADVTKVHEQFKGRPADAQFVQRTIWLSDARWTGFGKVSTWRLVFEMMGPWRTDGLTEDSLRTAYNAKYNTCLFVTASGASALEHHTVLSYLPTLTAAATGVRLTITDLRMINATEAAARGRASSELCALNQEHSHTTALTSYVIPDVAPRSGLQTRAHALAFMAENGVDLTLEQLQQEVQAVDARDGNEISPAASRS
jgi:hypothetical protein